nr:hypothetical protein [Tanacetum cinerariifolium]
KRKWQCGGSEVGKRDTSVHTAADEEVPVGGKGGDASVDSDLDNWGGWSREKQLQQVLSHLRNPANPWNTLKFLPNDQENGLHSPRREASTVGSSPPRKDIYGGAYTSSRSAPYRRGMPDDDTDGFPHLRERDNRLNFFWDAEIGLLNQLYDEHDGYGGEDEVHEGPDENINLTQEFEDMHLEEKNTTNSMENLFLGFNEGVILILELGSFIRNSAKQFILDHLIVQLGSFTLKSTNIMMGNEIKCTLWCDYAHQFNDFLNSCDDHGRIVLVLQFAMKFWDGKMCIQNGYWSTKLYLFDGNKAIYEDEYKEVEEFRQRLFANQPSEQSETLPQKYLLLPKTLQKILLSTR